MPNASGKEDCCNACLENDDFGVTWGTIWGMTRIYPRIPDLSFPLIEFPSAGR